MCKTALDFSSNSPYNELTKTQLRYSFGKEKRIMPEQKYMTTSKFAQRINVHPQTLRKWDKTGVLKAHHKTPGGRRFYTEEQALAFLNEKSGK